MRCVYETWRTLNFVLFLFMITDVLLAQVGFRKRGSRARSERECLDPLFACGVDRADGQDRGSCCGPVPTREAEKWRRWAHWTRFWPRRAELAAAPLPSSSRSRWAHLVGLQSSFFRFFVSGPLEKNTLWCNGIPLR